MLIEVEVVFGGVIGAVQVVGLRRVFGTEGVDLLHKRSDLELLSALADTVFRVARATTDLHTTSNTSSSWWWKCRHRNKITFIWQWKKKKKWFDWASRQRVLWAVMTHSTRSYKHVMCVSNKPRDVLADKINQYSMSWTNQRPWIKWKPALYRE